MADTVATAGGWAAGLDAAQLAAVEHDGPALIIVAGAGTGKTRTLVARLARVVERGVPPGRVLLVTFSRRAADELVRRLGHLVGADAARQVHCRHLSRRRPPAAPAARRPAGPGWRFHVLDPGDAADLMQLARQCVAAGAPDQVRRRLPRKDTLLAIYSHVVNARRPLAEVLPRSFPWVQEHRGPHCRNVRRVHRAQTLGKPCWISTICSCTGGPQRPTRSSDPSSLAGYDHVFVDEYQDTNLIQGDIVRLLRRDGRAVTVVGDDAQAIYAFRAATVRNMLEFPDLFPGAAVVRLERNYRSTQPILDLANAVSPMRRRGSASGCGRRRAAGPDRCWPPARTWRPRPLRSQKSSSSTTSRAWRFASRSCSSAAPITATCSKWSCVGVASRLSSMAACVSWKPPTCGTCWPRCGYWTTHATNWPGTGCCSWWMGSGPPRLAR